jgi:hypothetical protein
MNFSSHHPRNARAPKLAIHIELNSENQWPHNQREMAHCEIHIDSAATNSSSLAHPKKQFPSLISLRQEIAFIIII